MVQAYLNDRYLHLSHSIWLWAPRVGEGPRDIALPFGGRYRVEPEREGRIEVDGRAVTADQILDLAAGEHRSFSQTPYRLVLVPDLPEGLLPKEPVEHEEMFVNMYYE